MRSNYIALCTGGLTGLFLGMSTLSVFEMILCLIRIVCGLRIRRKKATRMGVETAARGNLDNLAQGFNVPNQED